MTARAWQLYGIGIRSYYHKLRHDLGREIVTLLSSGILLATFFYVFEDFLNVQVSSLSAAMRDRFAAAATLVTMLVATLAGARLIRAELDGERSLALAARTLGEEPRIIRAYLALRILTVVAVVHGLAWTMSQRWLLHLEPGVASNLEGLMLGATYALVFRSLRRRSRANRSEDSLPMPASDPRQSPRDGAEVNVLQTLVAWRLSQILRRNRTTRLALAIAAVLLTTLMTLAALKGAPTFVAAVAGLLGGFLVALALIYQAEEDVTQVWTERGLGVTHDQFVAAYERLSWRLGGAAALASAVLYAALAAAFQGAGGLPLAETAGKVLAMVWIPSLITPWLFLQIDARRPFINAVITLMVGLFIGTAVLAHWLSLLLLPLLRYYALNTQAGRFYRA